jgi:acyl carrier protein
MNTFERVRAIVANRLDRDEDSIVPDSALIGDLQADSLDVVEISMALEETFGIEIADDDMPNLQTVGQIVDYIEAQPACAA